MSERVRILELDIDSNALITRASDARKALENVKKESKDLKKVLDEQSNSLKESTDRLKDLEDQGKKNSDEYEAELRLHEQLNEAVSNQNDLYERSLSAQRRLQTEYNQTRRVLDAYNTTLEQEFHIITQTDGSRTQLQQALSNNRAIYSRLTNEQQENAEIGGRLLSIINEQTAEYNEQSNAIGITQVNVGNYTDSVVEALEKFKAGNISGFTDDVKNLGKEWISTTKSMATSILTMPVIGWLAALAVGIGLVFKEMYDYTAKIQPEVKKIDDQFQFVGDRADRLRVRIHVIAEQFQMEFNDIADTLDALMDSNLVKDELEGIQVIKEGLIKAEDKQGFIDQLNDAAQSAKQTGLNIQEVLNLNKALEGSPINAEAIYGALRKSSFQLETQADSLKSKLTAAFGAAFTNDILSQIQSGSITTTKALSLINDKTIELNLNTTQQAELGKELFGKSIFNAGGFATVMDLASQSVKGNTKELSELQKQLEKIIDKNIELADAQDIALKSDNIKVLKREFEVAWKEIQIGGFKALIIITDALKGLRLGAKNTADFFGILPKYFSMAAKAIATDVINLGNVWSSLNKVVKDAITLDFDSIDADLNKLKNSWKSSFSEIKKVGNEFSKELGVGGRINQGNIREINNASAAAALLDNDEKKPTTSGSLEDKIDSEKKDDDLKKKKKESEKKLAEETLKIAEDNAKAKLDILKTELDSYIRTNKSRIDNQAFVTKNLIQLENQRLDTILAKRIEVLNKEKELELSNTKLTEDQKKAIREKYAEEEKVLNEENESAKKETSDKYKEQQQQVEEFRKIEQHKKDLDDLENQGASEFEIKRSQLDFEYQNNEERKKLQKELELLDQQTQDEETLQRKADIELALTNIEGEYSEARSEIDKEEKVGKMNLAAGVAGAVADIAGRQTVVGKIAAGTEAAINTYTAATKALKDFPGPIGIAMAVATTAAGLLSVAKIAGVNTGSAQQGFQQISTIAKNYQSTFGAKRKAEKGILLKGNSHSQGGIDLFDGQGNHVVNAEGDELLAVINKRSTGLLSRLSDVNVLGGGIPLTHYVNHAANGGLISVPPQLDNNIIIDISDQIKDTLSGAAYDGIQRGMRDLSSDRQVEMDAQIK